jgi:hypothetical protein
MRPPNALVGTIRQAVESFPMQPDCFGQAARTMADWRNYALIRFGDVVVHSGVSLNKATEARIAKDCGVSNFIQTDSAIRPSLIANVGFS